MVPWKASTDNVQDWPGLSCSDQSAERLLQAAAAKGPAENSGSCQVTTVGRLSTNRESTKGYNASRMLEPMRL